MSVNPHGKAIELHVCIDVAKPFSLLSLGSNLGLNSMEDSIRLWIALAPPQMEELRTHHRVQPDISTSRIDLSATHAPVGRATDVQQCHTYNCFDYSFLQVEITALGYFRKMEANVPEKIRHGEFRWYGFLVPEERDEQGRLLYQIIDHIVANEPVHERPTRN